MNYLGKIWKNGHFYSKQPSETALKNKNKCGTSCEYVYSINRIDIYGKKINCEHKSFGVS